VPTTTTTRAKTALACACTLSRVFVVLFHPVAKSPLKWLIGKWIERSFFFMAEL
jgi:hypothetical protein